MTIPEIVASLRLAYPRQEFPDESVRWYIRQLADLDPSAVETAVMRLQRRSEWLPSIAEIRREVAEDTLQLPSVEDAWVIASRGALKEAPPEVRAAADAVGGRGSIKMSERPEAMSRWFRDEYRARRERAILEFAGANAVPVSPATLPGPTMAALPVSKRIEPRPIVMRWIRVQSGDGVDEPTDEEKADAIAYMRDHYSEESPEDPIYGLAESLMVEGRG